jgi:short-subunit dehydrogenase
LRERPEGADMEASKLVRGRSLPTSAAVARAAHRAMLAGDVVHVPGLRNKVLASSVRFTPRPVMRRIVHKIQEP